MWPSDHHLEIFNLDQISPNWRLLQLQKASLVLLVLTILQGRKITAMTIALPSSSWPRQNIKAVVVAVTSLPGGIVSTSHLTEEGSGHRIWSTSQSLKIAAFYYTGGTS